MSDILIIAKAAINGLASALTAELILFTALLMVKGQRLTLRELWEVFMAMFTLAFVLWLVVIASAQTSYPP